MDCSSLQDRRLAAFCFCVVIEDILWQAPADVRLPERYGSPRPWQVHARLRHGLGLLQFLAVADYLGRQLAGRDSVVYTPHEWRMGNGGLFLVVFHFAVRSRCCSRGS